MMMLFSFGKGSRAERFLRRFPRGKTVLHHAWQRSKNRAMITSQITSKGQTTIPLAVRKALGLKTYDRLVYEVKKGQTIIHPMRGTIFDHRNSVRPKQQPEDFGAVRSEVREQVARRAVERVGE